MVGESATGTVQQKRKIVGANLGTAAVIVRKNVTTARWRRVASKGYNKEGMSGK